LNHLLQSDGSLHSEVKPETVHVLGIELDDGRKQVQVEAACLEEMPGIAHMVGAKPRVLVGPGVRRGNKAFLLVEITRPAAYRQSALR
jgi:hypothetical protein